MATDRTEAEKEQREKIRMQEFDRLKRISYMANGASKFLRTIGKDLSGGGDIEEIILKQNTGAITLMSYQDMEDLFKDDEKDSKGKEDVYGQEYICWSCDISLYGKRFVNKESRPYCVPCFHDKFGHDCNKCSKLIEADTKDISFENKHWHEKCFTCSDCENILSSDGFNKKDEELFCTECFDEKFGDKCEECANVFKSTDLKLQWNEKQWHSECFLCHSCGTQIGQNKFHSVDKRAMCFQCWTDKFALICKECNNPLTNGGVTHKGEPYHRDCFVCGECKRSLAGQRFTRSEKGDNLCMDCYANNHSSTCFECQTPITGINGLKYLMFEGFNWHPECFYCKSCGDTLCGNSFVAEGSSNQLELFCQPCGFKRKGWTFADKQIIE